MPMEPFEVTIKDGPPAPRKREHTWHVAGRPITLLVIGCLLAGCDGGLGGQASPTPATPTPAHHHRHHHHHHHRCHHCAPGRDGESEDRAEGGAVLDRHTNSARTVITTEDIKIRLRSVSGSMLVVEGRDLMSLRPRLLSVGVAEAAESLRPTVDGILEALGACFEDLPPQVGARSA